MKRLILILTLITAQTLAKEVALTIDDAPLGDGFLYSGIERTEKFIREFKKENIQVAFFCNSMRLELSNGTERLNSYAAAGHVIANHTHSHPRLSKTSTREFISDMNKADSMLESFSTFKKWFRFPYLNEGATIDQRDEVRRHLRDNGYINGFVTVDDYDYMIEDFIKKGIAKKFKINFKNACDMLGALTIDGLEEQLELGNKYLGQVLPQVLLMHENDIEAYCIDQIIKTLKDKGWKIVSPEIPFQDPHLTKEPNTLWLDQGRIAALVAQRTGKTFKSKWDSTTTLNTELNRRNIVDGHNVQ